MQGEREPEAQPEPERPPTGDSARAGRLRRRRERRKDRQRRNGRQAGQAAQGRPGRRTGLVAGVLTALCVLLVITDVLFYTGLPGVFSGIHTRSAVDSARTDAVSAASDTAVALLSYDYRHMDADIAAAAKHLTPSFRKDYLKTADAVKAPAKDSQARVSALVSDAGVIQADPDQATVLLFVTQTVQNNKLSAPRTDLYRVRMRVENVDGHWLVDAVEAL